MTCEQMISVLCLVHPAQRVLPHASYRSASQLRRQFSTYERPALGTLAFGGAHSNVVNEFPQELCFRERRELHEASETNSGTDSKAVIRKQKFQRTVIARPSLRIACSSSSSIRTLTLRNHSNGSSTASRFSFVFGTSALAARKGSSRFLSRENR